MTACVNRKHTKKVAAVVTASLVGALSLGAAPVAAVADTGIELQAASWSTGAKVTAATDGKGAVVTGDLERKSFTEKSGKFLVPTEVTGTYVTTEIDEGMLTYEKRQDDGSWKEIGDLEKATKHFAEGAADEDNDTTGTYRVIIEDTEGKHTVPFKIIGEGKAEGVTVKGTPTYNGADQAETLSFVDAEGYEIANGKENEISFTNNKGEEKDDVTGAGSYVANFTVDGNDYSVAFSIAKLDLSKSTVVVEDGETFIANDDQLLGALSVNGGDEGALKGDLVVTKVVNPSGSAGYGTTGAKGAYQVTVAPEEDNANVTGSATITYYVLHNDVADKVVYNRVDYTGKPLEIELAYGDVFDASKIVVKDDEDNSYSGDRLEITYTDTENNETVDASALANVGEYELTIRIKPSQDFTTGEWTGGTITLNVEVLAVGLNDDEDLAFFFDGELAGNTESVTYDGTDQLEKVSVVVKDADGNDLVEGTDYEVKVTSDDTGREVDSIVDAGTYVIKVSPLTFSFDDDADGDSLTLTVNPVKIGIDGENGDLKNFEYIVDDSNPSQIVVEQNDAVAYTGSAVEVPAVKYPVLDDEGNVKLDKDDKVVYADLSTDLYNIVSIKNEDKKTVTEAVEEGYYTVKIALSDAAKSNYVLADDDFIFQIREAGHFTDVDSTKWYSTAVEKAYSQWYINGISGTNLFAPEADITRADAVCIIYNMAGGDSIGDEDFSFDVDYGYNTGFNDVDGHAYFAKALAWARAFGVANGSNGEFRPYDQITREEFASLLANYAKAMGKFEAADASALDGVSDAGTVSDWAKDNVAWAVENGIMGNGGFVAGQSNIIRAEVAAMAVNYQPEMIRTDKLPR